jgi:hypothetical protein
MFGFDIRSGPPTSPASGLLAFGGSLLGTSSFFGAGSLDPAAQWIVLLPFLFLVWRGMVAQSADRRDLALLGSAWGFPSARCFWSR